LKEKYRKALTGDTTVAGQLSITFHIWTGKRIDSCKSNRTFECI